MGNLAKDNNKSKPTKIGKRKKQVENVIKKVEHSR